MALDWKRATQRSGYWGYDWYAEVFDPDYPESGRVLLLVKQDPRRDYPDGFWSAEVLDHGHGHTHSFSLPIPSTSDLEEAKRYVEERAASLEENPDKKKKSNPDKETRVLKNRLLK